MLFCSELDYIKEMKNYFIFRKKTSLSNIKKIKKIQIYKKHK